MLDPGLTANMHSVPLLGLRMAKTANAASKTKIECNMSLKTFFCSFLGDSRLHYQYQIRHVIDDYSNVSIIEPICQYQMRSNL